MSTAGDRLDPRQYDEERAAKRAAIAERIRAEKAAAEAAAFNARLARETRQQEERLNRDLARDRARWDTSLVGSGRIGYDRQGRLHCHHNTLYDSCSKCQADAAAEWAAEAAANA